MRDRTLGDPTQRAILPYLLHTERMLARAASAESGKECDAEIIALSDLGIATNLNRMLAGFFTGALYRWDAPVPIAPVDATVNVCSVSIFRIASSPDTANEFLALLTSARERCEAETEFHWNLAAGNHFVSLGSISGCDAVADGDYLVMHASASEYKRTPIGLYPGPGVWFADQLREVNDGERRLRYLTGSAAERFIATAHWLVDHNAQRHAALAGLIAGELGLEEVSCLPHYGMPDDESVAVGCHWLEREDPGWFLLLTEPDADIPLVSPRDNEPVTLGGEERLLTPHGLGVSSRSGRVRLGTGGLTLGGGQLDEEASPLDDGDTEWRSLNRDPGLLEKILEKSPGEAIGWFRPRFSYHRGNVPPSHA